jgi:hypothetical protein
MYTVLIHQDYSDYYDISSMKAITGVWTAPLQKSWALKLSKKKKIVPEKQDTIAVANLYDMTTLLHCTN